MRQKISKKQKYQKMEEEYEEKTKQNKKLKQKKKKKQIPQRVQEYAKTQHETKTNQIKPQKTTAQTKPIDPITAELSLLTFTPHLSPSIASCQLINSHLQQLTINLYETMIMKSSLIMEAIQIARKQLLTPKEYFSIDYTNKLLLIRSLLCHNGEVKYSKYIGMIEEQVQRVEKLVMRCMQQVRLFDEVLMDLKKNNVEWDVVDDMI